MEYFKGLIAEDLKDAVEFRKTSAAETESLKLVKENFPVIMKENMQLQLEAQYRKNVQTVATELIVVLTTSGRPKKRESVLKRSRCSNSSQKGYESGFRADDASTSFGPSADAVLDKTMKIFEDLVLDWEVKKNGEISLFTGGSDATGSTVMNDNTVMEKNSKNNIEMKSV